MTFKAIWSFGFLPSSVLCQTLPGSHTFVSNEASVIKSSQHVHEDFTAVKSSGKDEKRQKRSVFVCGGVQWNEITANQMMKAKTVVSRKIRNQIIPSKIYAYRLTWPWWSQNTVNKRCDLCLVNIPNMEAEKDMGSSARSKSSLLEVDVDFPSCTTFMCYFIPSR